MKTWKKFAHVNAKSIDEASSILRAGKAAHDFRRDGSPRHHEI